MKRVALLCVGLAAAFIFGGCGTPSINALATEATTVADEGLVGSWLPADSDDSDSAKAIVVTVGHAEDKTYLLSVPAEEDQGGAGKPMTLALRVVALGDHRFLDVTAPDAKLDELKDYGAVLLPLHHIYKVSRKDDVLTLWEIDGEWLGQELQGRRIRLDHANVGESKSEVLTASTEDLQKFFLANADQKKLFPTPVELKRVPVKPAAAPVKP